MNKLDGMLYRTVVLGSLIQFNSIQFNLSLSPISACPSLSCLFNGFSEYLAIALLAYLCGATTSVYTLNFSSMKGGFSRQAS